ncbi:MAG: hypothetical protein ACYC1M_13485 [Armatimonadota bacterium]
MTKKTIITKALSTLVLGIIMGMLAAYSSWVSYQTGNVSHLDSDSILLQFAVAIYIVWVAPNAYLSFAAYMLGHAIGFLRTIPMLLNVQVVDILPVPDYFDLRGFISFPLFPALVTLVVRRLPHWVRFVRMKVSKQTKGTE